MTTNAQVDMLLAEQHYTLPLVADAPPGAEEAYVALQKVPDNIRPQLGTYFVDSLGRKISVWTNERGRAYVPMGDSKALWDLRCNNLCVDENGKIYHRDRDKKDRRPIQQDSWHEILDIATEYKITGKEISHAWDNLISIELSTNPKYKKMLNGIRFNNCVFYRNSFGNVIKSVNPEDMCRPARVVCHCDWTPELAKEGREILTRITADPFSAANLIRLYAEPVLEAQAVHIYCIYGRGGNGKSTVLDPLEKEFPELAKAVDVSSLTDRDAFTRGQAILSTRGLIWAIDEDADNITGRDQTTLKTMATHGQMEGRLISHNMIRYTPEALPVIASNHLPVLPDTKAMERRYVFVKMSEEVPHDEFAKTIVPFVKEHKADAFIAASCELWMQSDDPFPIVIADMKDLTDYERQLLTLVHRRGFAIPADLPRVRQSEKSIAFAKLGLENRSKRFGKKVKNIIEVADQARYKAWESAFVDDLKDNGNYLDALLPIPGSIISGMTARTFGFPCDYIPCGQDPARPKACFLNWQELTKNSHGKNPLPKTKVYGVLPLRGWSVIDFDAGEKGGPDGFTMANIAIGKYGSPAFPHTYAVRSPHGVHLYYKIPPAYIDRIKDAVHPDGIPIDIRCNHRGFVIGVDSVLPDGSSYIWAGSPDPIGKEIGPIPELTPEMIEFLAQHGYIEDLPVQQPVSFHYPPSHDGEGNPDLSYPDTGARNNTVHRDTVGRLFNYPNEWPRILKEEGDRAIGSGLPQREALSLLRSSVKYVRSHGITGDATSIGM